LPCQAAAAWTRPVGSHPVSDTGKPPALDSVIRMARIRADVAHREAEA